MPAVETLSHYFDYARASPLVKNFIESWIRGLPVNNCLILSGTTGCGKTSLVRAIANEYNLTLVETNASDERRKNDLLRTFKNAITNTIGGNIKLLFLDEADNLPKPVFNQLKKFIKTTPSPVIIACNNEYAIPKAIKDDSWVIDFPYPTEEQRYDFVEFLEETQGLKIDKVKGIIARRFSNFRAIVLALETFDQTSGIISVIGERDLDTRGQIESLLRNPLYRMKTNPTRLLTWFYDNTNNHELLDEINELLGFAPSGDNCLVSTDKTYEMWKYAYPLFHFVNLPTIEYPRTFILMSKRKEQKNAEPKVKVKKRESIIHEPASSFW